ncbi:MAG: Ig-like domain-containing protein, partial [Deltaproteobacteria bacterium]|nr:Ig-like domain-containing protein [Deltaproteobacteria bacterium]
DDKRPALVTTTLFDRVQVCEDDLGTGATQVTDAIPTTWYVRVMFDELLDPNIEELVEILDPDTGLGTDQFTGTIAGTNPVSLMCNGVAVAYDGYYSPSGNSITWPLGPSLVIQPSDTSAVATGAECTLTLKPEVIVDKDGVAITSGDTGPYTFKIAPLVLESTDPAPPEDPADPDVVDPAAPVVLTFNATIDPASLAASEILLEQVTACDAAAGIERIPAITQDLTEGGPQTLFISDSAAGADLAFVPETTYRLTFTDTNEVADLAGGTGAIPGAADLTICFTTDVAQ